MIKLERTDLTLTLTEMLNTRSKHDRTTGGMDDGEGLPID